MKSTNTSNRTKKTVFRFLILFIAAGVLYGGWYFFGGKFSSQHDSEKGLNVYTVKRGDLTISRIESGDIRSINSVDIKSEVEGRTTIIYIVDEGTYITQEDVNNGMILVELDSSDIKQKLTKQKIDYLEADARFTDANESLEIQKKQNDSDITAGKMKRRFAMMDFRKYLGESVAGKIISDTNELSSSEIDFISFLDKGILGGGSLQKLKELNDDITLAESKLERATDTLKWTKKLYDQEYVAETELKADMLEVQSLKIQKERAEIELELFKSYDFLKESEKLFSDHQEANRELERIEARARSKWVQALARLKSSEATYQLQKERLEKMEKQFKACTIKAPTTGQVTYYQGSSRWSRRVIAVGEQVRERQTIISIPDSSQMKVEVKVHETWIDKVEPNQPARITVAAFPEMKFTGRVIKKAPLADLEQWMNPDLKVYSTDVSIDGTHDFLKTGMTAKVEIIVEQLKDVIKIPIHAVTSIRDKKVCYVRKNRKTEQREVEVGEFNSSFIEIKSGLAEGEQVLLNPPRMSEFEEDLEEQEV